MIESNVKHLLEKIPKTNKYGERVTLVAAVKLQSVENINRAVAAGIRDIGDNHVQEFKEKYGGITGGPRRHFIGHLQTNKVKYLIGKTDLYHSLDRYPLAEEISKRSLSAGVVSRALMQINIGEESSKGGFGYGEAAEAYEKIKLLPSLEICGLMAMLPVSDDRSYLSELAEKMRLLYDKFKQTESAFEYLSMGMSGDWEICLEAGSNMLRLGTSIFGQRNYAK